MYLYQYFINIYVEEQLHKLGVTQEETVRRSGVPQDLVNRFLTDLNDLTLGEKLRVVIQFGSVIGDPVGELGPLCGIQFGGEDSEEDLQEPEDDSAKKPVLVELSAEELEKRGIVFPADGSPPDLEAVRQMIADMDIDWDGES